MKIYKYYKGKIYSVDVRETEKMYIIDHNVFVHNSHQTAAAFGYRSRFLKKDHWSITPLEAVRERINQNVSFRQTLKNKIHKIDSELDTLRKLEKIYE